jgi:hypothetical protein
MGKERLAEPGFYVEYVISDPDFDKPDGFGLVYIPPDVQEGGKCKYIHFLDENGGSWATVMWSCAPTKKKVARGNVAAEGEICERYLYFPTHDDLCNFAYINHKPGALIAP